MLNIISDPQSRARIPQQKLKKGEEACADQHLQIAFSFLIFFVVVHSCLLRQRNAASTGPCKFEFAANTVVVSRVSA